MEAVVHLAVGLPWEAVVRMVEAEAVVHLAAAVVHPVEAAHLAVEAVDVHSAVVEAAEVANGK